MNDINSREILNNSLTRCKIHPDFVHIFYEHLLDTSPHIRELFSKLDLEVHMGVVEKSLVAMIIMGEDDWINQNYLKELAEKHKGMQIKPEYFKLWEISLMATIAECDPEYNEEIRHAWKNILSKGMDFLVNYQ